MARLRGPRRASVLPVLALSAAARPWRPLSPGSKDPRLVVDDTEQGHVPFSVVELAGGALVGTATLWGIDTHSRLAHLGLGLLPSARGKGYGTGVVAVLCRYWPFQSVAVRQTAPRAESIGTRRGTNRSHRGLWQGPAVHRGT
ncbi:GNAT family N-acetyltransferase [Streptomyces sp. B93]|nr:GNAT family N-acetyltransferase [Streptomyces sp. B93]